MKNIFIGTVMLILLASLSSCSAGKRATRLANHQAVMSRVAGSKSINPEQKLDTLITSFVGMMNEALNIANPKKGVQYVKKYSGDNQQNIRQIVEEFATYSNSLEKGQKVSMGIGMLLKPHIGDMIRLVPKFIRKYQRYKTVMDITRQFKNQLKPFGIKGLTDDLFEKAAGSINNK
jgi:hypothetical protein